MKIEVICGNPQAGGRTSKLALDLGVALAGLIGTEAPDEVIELSAYGGDFFKWGAPGVAALKERLKAARFLVIATPTYKASFTGLTKAFLDQYGAGELQGTVTIPVFTGGSDAHSLAPDFTLRPVLVELGTSVPTNSLYAVTSSLENQPALVAGFIDTNRYTLLGAAHGIALRLEASQ